MTFLGWKQRQESENKNPPRDQDSDESNDDKEWVMRILLTVVDIYYQEAALVIKPPLNQKYRNWDFPAAYAMKPLTQPY